MSKEKNPTAAEVTAELNEHLHSPVSIIAVRRHLHNQEICSRAAIPKPLVTDVNVKRHLQWGHNPKPAQLISRKQLYGPTNPFSHFPPKLDSCTIWRRTAHLYDCDYLLSL